MRVHYSVFCAADNHGAEPNQAKNRIVYLLRALRSEKNARRLTATKPRVQFEDNALRNPSPAIIPINFQGRF